MARQFYSGEDPLGQKIQVMNGTKPAEIIGIVGDVRDQNLTTKGLPAVYEPAAQIPFAGMTLAVRTEREPEMLIGGARAAIREIDPELPLDAVGTLDSMIGKSVTVRAIRHPPHAELRRTRSSLGDDRNLWRAVVCGHTGETGDRDSDGAWSPARRRPWPGAAARRDSGRLGILIGIAGAMGIGRLLAPDLYEVKGVDPTVYLGVVAVLVATGITACSVPAMRAARIDPLEALREE
jgi:putative ABC transport system permease protein